MITVETTPIPGPKRNNRPEPSTDTSQYDADRASPPVRAGVAIAATELFGGVWRVRGAVTLPPSGPVNVSEAWSPITVPETAKLGSLPGPLFGPQELHENEPAFNGKSASSVSSDLSPAPN